jgi:excisionase family DNA binding protein
MGQKQSSAMTVHELAGRMGIDQSTAWRYLRAGKLPGVQVGRRWLIDRERVERFLAGKEDAAGVSLMPVEPTVLASVVAPGASDPPVEPAPVLELVPRTAQSDTAQAVTWLRGLMAALDLLATTVEITAEREAPRRLEA